MLTAIILTTLAVLFRVFSSTWQVWNFAPLAAVSLFAGSRLPRRWAWIVPILAMAISDYLIDHNRYRPVFELTRLTIYATFAATTLLGPLANRPRIGRWLLPVLSLSGSTLFFLTSNLATWGEGQLYPMTFSGLISCYALAIPFFGNTVAADLLGTALLFGLGPIVERGAQRLTRPRLAEIPNEVMTPKSSRPA
jgi:nucleoside recognition membrane protein YjiH